MQERFLLYESFSAFIQKPSVEWHAAFVGRSAHWAILPMSLFVPFKRAILKASQVLTMESRVDYKAGKNHAIISIVNKVNIIQQ